MQLRYNESTVPTQQQHTTPMPLQPAPNAPIANKKPSACSAHGKKWTDDYAWLRADNWQQALRQPDVLPCAVKSYLQQENAYFRETMEGTQDLQQQLINEMRGRMLENEDSLPDKDGPYEYLHRYIEGGEHPVYLRKKTGSSSEEITLDINKEATDQEYFDHDLVEHSPDHTMLLWSRDTNGAEYYRVSIRNLADGRDSDYVIEDVDTAVWADNKTVYYTRVDQNHRPSKVYRHTPGTDPHTDVLVYEEHDTKFYCSVYVSASRDFVFISTGMNDQDEVWFIPTSSPHSKPIVIEPRTDGLEYSVEHQDSRFIILTNADSAIDFKIVEAPLETPARENWKDLLAHRQGTMIRSVEVYRDWIMWFAVENALPRICYTNNNHVINSIAFEEEAYSLSMSSSYNFDDHTIRFSYSSPTTPDQTYQYDLQTAQRTLLKSQVIPSGHNNHDYVTRRIMAQSHDGAEVPVTLLHHIDTPVDGTAPCLLYGYGSYGSSIPACFSGNRLSLVDRGFVYAIAHVRGGQEKGRAWYEGAKLEKKINSFQDFIASAETLIESGYTTAGKITIQGGSAGGLLIGAVLNMKADLFGAAIADVPFVDVLNTILDDTLPLTPGEWSQWGNPIDSKTAFENISGYSPYDNVTEQDYPPLLVTAGVSDPRVTYWEPAKWVAKLRATKTDNNVLLLKTNMSSGHFGKTGRFAELEDTTLSYAFAIIATADKSLTAGNQTTTA